MAEESIKFIIDMALNLKTDIVREVFFKVIGSLEFGKWEKTSDYCYMNEHKEIETKIFIELDTKRIYCNVAKDLFFTFRYDGEVFVNTTNEAMWQMFTKHLQDLMNARDVVEVEETKKIFNKILDLAKEVL